MGLPRLILKIGTGTIGDRHAQIRPPIGDLFDRMSLRL